MIAIGTSLAETECMLHLGTGEVVWRDECEGAWCQGLEKVAEVSEDYVLPHFDEQTVAGQRSLVLQHSTMCWWCHWAYQKELACMHAQPYGCAVGPDDRCCCLLHRQGVSAPTVGAR